jgi:hypothetical protein
MALKRPGVKKPVSKPVEVEVEVPQDVVVNEPEQQVEETVVEAVEEDPDKEEAIEIPVIYDPPQEPVVDEVVQEEVVEEPVVEEPVVEEPVVEEKPKKKRNSKKKAAAKEEPKEEVVKESLPKMGLEEGLSIMQSLACTTTEAWEAEKAEIQENVRGIVIDPDATPGEMKELIAEIGTLLSELKIMKVNVEERNNGILEHIEYVRLKNSTGSNAEERKTNGIEAMMNYKTSPDATEATNLLDLKVYLTNQVNFYNEMISILVEKKNLLITFSGLTKIEAQLGGY